MHPIERLNYEAGVVFSFFAVMFGAMAVAGIAADMLLVGLTCIVTAIACSALAVYAIRQNHPKRD